MKRGILYTFCGLTLLSCGGSEGRFRLKGEFDHLQQGEFYIYSNDGGLRKLDTIPVVGGEFDYETALETQATFYLLYPNLSEQVIFGASGDVVTIEGDARNLKAVEVKGNQANRDMTDFRRAQEGKSASESRKAAADFIRQSPASPVSVFLFREYFLRPGSGVSVNEVREHYRALCKAQPDNLQLLYWRADLESLFTELKKGDKLPDFRLVMEDSSEVKTSDYKGKPLLINFWASWENGSSSLMFRIKRLAREHSGEIGLLSVSLDLNRKGKEGIERRDTVTWPSYCDFLAWESPVVRQFGVRTLPYCILAGKDGRVIAAGTYEKDIQPELEKLLESK